jgi:hypothetical protein
LIESSICWRDASAILNLRARVDVPPYRAKEKEAKSRQVRRW